MAKCRPSSSSRGLVCGLGHGVALLFSVLSPRECRPRALLPPTDVVDALFRCPLLLGVAILDVPGGAARGEGWRECRLDGRLGDVRGWFGDAVRIAAKGLGPKPLGCGIRDVLLLL